MGELVLAYLGDVADIQQGRYLAKEDMADKQSASYPVPVHGANGIIGWTNSASYKHGVPLVTCRGSNSGMVLWANGPLCVSNNAMAILPKIGDIDFLYYALLCIPPYAVVTGSAQPQITRRDLSKFQMPWTDEATQRNLASILRALDDKIELNRRTNETLEAMARALFRDWFVDFGPTRAKMEGRAPYLAPDLWALFPDRLDDATGLPEGWEQLPLGSFGEITIGGLWGNDEPENSDYEPYFCLRGVDLQHLREQGAALKTPCRFAKRAAIEKRTVRTTDVLIASSGAGPCGRPLWIGVQGFFAGRAPTIYSNFVKRIACKTNYHACYVDRHLHEMKVSGEIQKYISGTSVPNLNDKGLMESHKIPSPTEPILQAFLDFSMLVQEQLFSGENAVLAEARDLLLPKLMSGEIRLRDAEKLAEEAAA